MQLLVKQMAQ